jgi:CTP:molybdopterin cytidylyltransferase MocA
MNPAAVILAAGASVRLGRPKQLLEMVGETLIRRSARLCKEAGFDPVVVVLGSSAAEVAAALDGLAVSCLINAGWTEGMASSIRIGIGSLPEKTSGVLLLPCDQPALSLHLLREFRKVHESSPGTTLASCYGGGAGIPALFPRQRFPELELLQGDRGAKGLVGDAVLLSFPGGELDFDTPEDVEAWLRR